MTGAEVWLSEGKARVIPAAPLALTRLVQGKTAAEVAALLPRLFNLCPMAQDQAARLALGQALLEDTTCEVVKTHLSRLFVTLRAALGLRPLPPPASAQGLFGPAFPQDLDGLARFLSRDLALADLARTLARRFAPGQGLTKPLPFPKGAQALSLAAHENSPAGRQAAHPLLQALEAREGRSPFWRLIGLMADLDAALARRLPADMSAPAPETGPGDGMTTVAVVQASRGAYALCVTLSEGRVTGLTRRTPTDHLLAPGGAVQQSMATCPAPLAPLLLALHDPCVAVTLREEVHA